MLTTVATVLAGLVGAALLFMGASVLTMPQAFFGFGIPNSPADTPAFRSWVRVKGARELPCGILVFVLMAVATPSVLGWYLLVLALAPAGDALIVLRSGGPKAIAYGVHAATALVMLVTGVCLLV